MISTWAWGNQLLWGYSTDDDAELQQTYDFVTSKGLTWFDTADSYGTGKLSGRSETLLGQFSSIITSSSSSRSSSAAKGSKNVNFCTKIAPFPWRIGKEAMKRCALASQDRLQRPIDMLQLHWPPTLGWQEAEYLEAFAELVESGSAVQIGLSNYGPRGLRRVVETLQQRGCAVYSNQVQFSLLSRQPLTSGLADVCAELGVQPIGYSPLALGLLTDRYTLDALPRGPRSLLFREFLPLMQPLLKELRDIAQQRRKTVAQVALNWNLQKGFLVLVGIRSVQQAKENLAAAGWALTAAEVESIDRAAAKIPKSLVQNPNQGT